MVMMLRGRQATGQPSHTGLSKASLEAKTGNSAPPSVIARSEATKQSMDLALDCFAELVIGPATSGRTRWLAMTGKPVDPFFKQPQTRDIILAACPRPRDAVVGAPQIIEGAGKAGCSAAPAARQATNKRPTSKVTTGSTDKHPAFPAQWV